MTKVSLVTGASRSLGRNTAVSIAHRGGDVAVTYQSREASAQSVVGEIEAMDRKAIALQLDTVDVAGFAERGPAAGNDAHSFCEADRRRLA